MTRKGITIEDAARMWVSEFSRFPQDMILKLMSIDAERWHEVTAPSVGDSVYLFNVLTKDRDGNEYEGRDREGEIIKLLGNKDIIVHLNDGTEVVAKNGYFDIQRYDRLPMWGTMWQFGDSADDYWLEKMDGIRIMSDCGFRIYESDDWGYFFGIDGCGYNFYEAHWIPLYKKRGLQWHDTETKRDIT